MRERKNGERRVYVYLELIFYSFQKVAWDFDMNILWFRWTLTPCKPSWEATSPKLQTTNAIIQLLNHISIRSDSSIYITYIFISYSSPFFMIIISDSLYYSALSTWTRQWTLNIRSRKIWISFSLNLIETFAVWWAISSL